MSGPECNVQWHVWSYIYLLSDGSLEYEGMWVYNRPENKNDAGQCQAMSAMFSDGVVPDPIYLSCDTPAPFICRKMIVIEGKHG